MSEHSQGSRSPELVVAESLLAIAKDARYIQECQALLLQVLTPFIASRHDVEQHWGPTTELLSSLLYAVMVLARKKRTAGMEVTGIEFGIGRQRWTLVVGALASAVWIYGIRRCAAAVRANLARNATESLTGAQRRYVFEQQRQEMVQRAAFAGSIVDHASSTAGEQAPTTATLAERLQSIYSDLIQSLDAAVTGRSEGPHAIQDASGSSSRALSIGSWLVRLHLALFCINGTYPAWAHRLLYRTPLRLEPGRTNALVDRPNSTRIVGFLVLTQAAWTLIQAVCRRMIVRLVDSRIAADRTNNVAEEVRPCIQFKGLPAAPVVTNTNCAICRNVRRFPACSVTCGHVFCWHCLQQWVASNTAACPLCRKDCTASDIMLLHNYGGPTTSG